MRIRRCSGLAIEPRETLAFDLEDLLAGGDGCRATRRWIAWAPHLDAEVELEPDEVLALGEVSPSRWTELRDGDAAVARLIAKGLVVREDGDDPARERDARLRARNWRVQALALHYFTRWHGVGGGPGGCPGFGPGGRWPIDCTAAYQSCSKRLRKSSSVESRFSSSSTTSGSSV